MINWLYPEAFVLLLPAAALWWHLHRTKEVGMGLAGTVVAAWRSPRSLLHFVILIVGILALASPVRQITEVGSDLVLVIDRSASMDHEDGKRVEELIGLAEGARGPEDRLGIVTFGRINAIEQRPRQQKIFAGYTKRIDDQGSDLRAALDTALSTVTRGRQARILVLSDGEYTGADPRGLGWEAASRSIPIDFRHFPRSSGKDVAVGHMTLPRRVHRGEGFQFSAQILATHDSSCDYELRSRGVLIAKGTVPLRAGDNQLIFRGRPVQVGPSVYELRISGSGDANPKNDYGTGVTQVEGEGSILLLTSEGDGGNLARAMESAGHSVDVMKASEARLTLKDLVSRPAVVLENVPATAFDSDELKTLARYVEDTGGGLLVTGGRRSFGIGGYYKSPLEQTLPVSLELRKEARKLRLAIAFVLDRSGSMGMSVGAFTKMDLANRGCVAAVDLLTAMDEAAVSAVDSEPHRVVPLAPLKDKSFFKNQVLGITAGGGGIYTYTGLAAGARELADSTAGTRHIVLFADAADAEEPGEYVELLRKLGESGVTVSVIALGTDQDRDADFLRDVASRGKGQIYFTTDPAELPQLFGMETINISRAAFVDEVVSVKSHGALAALGENTWSEFPDIAGYNLTYIRSEATLGLSTQDEFEAPLLASWQRGLGRCAVFTGETDGLYSGDLSGWQDYDVFFATLCNWLGGDGSPDELMGKVSRSGDVVKVELEFDPEFPERIPTETPILHVIAENNERAIRTIPLTWDGPNRMTASYRLENDSIHFHRISVGAKHGKLGCATLPYNPEFVSRVDRPDGRLTLALLAQRSGGQERSILDHALFQNTQERKQLRSMSLLLAILFLLLITWEIAARRLGLGSFQWRSKKQELEQQVARTPSVSPPAPQEPESTQSPIAQDAIDEANKLPTIDILKEAKRRSR